MGEDWPSWATQKIEIHTWDASWQQRATELIAALEPLLENWLEVPIEHVGSTAVPGLAAKPVIDLQARRLTGRQRAGRSCAHRSGMAPGTARARPATVAPPARVG